MKRREAIATLMTRLGLALFARNPTFSYFFLSRTSSRIGENVFSLAVPWLVFQLTGSALQLGLAFAVQVVPSLLLAPFAGVYADAASRTKVMLVAESFRALLGLAVAGLSLLGNLQAWHLYLAVVAHAVTASFLTVAAGAVVPTIVDQVDLTRANALLRLSRNACDLFGKVMTGVLLAWVGPVYTFMANAALSVASAALLPIRRMDGESLVVRGRRPRVLQDFVSGVGILRRHSTALLAMADLVVVNVGIPVLVIALPVVSEQVLRHGAAGYGFLTGAMALGAIAATLIATPLAGRMDEHRLSGLATVLFGFLVGSLGFVGGLEGWLLAVTLAGLTAELVSVYTASILQRTLPSEVLGRAFGVQYAALRVIPVVVFLSAGEVLQRFGVQTLLILGGSATALIAALLLYIRVRGAQ
ncbi:MFS transporter [Thermus tengchongensis]|uniref:MFS transporter n=1 Tax=Thermus tengchongensis TaxID=1214928 RepID=A0ABY2K5S2_9DEIN|nr:MFS transporter [Thermus tengchongensis]TFU15930.1 MFS transporter [Thermus tengchongensis]